MKSDLTYRRLVIISIFVITFMIFGWVFPIFAASYMPQSEVIEAHSFRAEDVNQSDDSHSIIFDRTVKRGSSGEVFTELYLLDKDGNRVKVDSTSNENYFGEGRIRVVRHMDLPEDMEPGEYRYVLVAKFDMANGRVERSFSFKSEKFTVS